MTYTILGIFLNKEDGKDAMIELQESNFDPQNISPDGFISFDLGDKNMQEYQEGITRGGLLIAIPATEDTFEQAQDILNAYNATNVKLIEISPLEPSDHEEDFIDEYIPFSYPSLGVKGGTKGNRERKNKSQQKKQRKQQRGKTQSNTTDKR